MIQRKINYQAGQSLIETIVAIFILTTSLTAGLTLSIYAFSSAAVSQHEIIASNLAREAIDVVRAMRDSNWLASDVKEAAWGLRSCPDIDDRNCYPRSYQKVPPYNNYDLSAGNQRAVFDSASKIWSLDNTNNYNLYVQADGTYTPSSTGAVPVFARMINISFNSSSPYTGQNSNQEMIVKSVVAWRGQKCTAFNSNQNLLTLSTPCKVVVEEHMTNWKDYK